MYSSKHKVSRQLNNPLKICRRKNVIFLLNTMKKDITLQVSQM